MSLHGRGVSRLMAFVIVGVSLLIASCSLVTRNAEGRGNITVLESSGLDSATAFQLAEISLCYDEYGRQFTRVDRVGCMPCFTPAASASANTAVAHARALWKHIGRLPFDSANTGARCVKKAYEVALDSSLNDRGIRVEAALLMTMAADPRDRIVAVTAIDAVIDTMLHEGDTTGAVVAYESVAMSMWERAQVMHSRPTSFPLHPAEQAVHEFVPQSLPLVRLPPPTRKSNRYGESEALWSSRVFFEMSKLVSKPSGNARARRLALAPLVMLGEWRSLDSAASSMLKLNPRDSVALVARALAQYRTVRNPPSDYTRVMSSFDDALRNMPRADSMAFDAFDFVLAEQDDEWRYSFMPGKRNELDNRAWVVIDPLWMTPVNELRLERRARVAEADFRYAHTARPNESGSETRLGALLLKRGVPDDSWRDASSTGRRSFGINGSLAVFRRGWPGIHAELMASADSALWRIFYSERIELLQQVTQRVPEGHPCPGLPKPVESIAECARLSSADFRDVPFYGKTDTIDVTAARFRVSDDSVDLYVGARLPLRRFRAFDDKAAATRDSISMGVWISTEAGVPLFHDAVSRRLPAVSEIMWRNDWRIRIPVARTMHRVEAIEANAVSGARGWQRVTSADHAFVLEGFGLSDIIVADSIVTARNPVSWRDLVVAPNGGAITTGRDFSLGWEIYGLSGGPDGRARWRVNIRREDGRTLTNTDTRGVIVGTPTALDKVLPAEPDASSITYSRESPASDKIVEFVRMTNVVSLPGRHVLIVAVTDLVAKTTTTRAVALRVLASGAHYRERIPSGSRRNSEGIYIPDRGSYVPPIPPPLPIIKPPPVR